MKPEVMVYSGIVLMAHVLDFAERAYGIQVTNELVAQTTKLLAENLFKKLNVSPEQLQQLINNGAEEIRAYKSGRLTPEMVQEKVQRAGAVMTGGASVVPSSDGAGALPTGGTGVGGGGGNGG